MIHLSEYEVHLLQTTLDYFKIDHQSDKFAEESSELTAVLMQAKDGRATKAHIIEEIADTFITLSQLILHYGLEESQQEISKRIAQLPYKVQCDINKCMGRR